MTSDDSEMEGGWRPGAGKKTSSLGRRVPAMLFSNLCAERWFILFAENVIVLWKTPKSGEKTQRNEEKMGNLDKTYKTRHQSTTKSTDLVNKSDAPGLALGSKGMCRIDTMIAVKELFPGSMGRKT